MDDDYDTPDELLPGVQEGEPDQDAPPKGIDEPGSDAGLSDDATQHMQ